MVKKNNFWRSVKLWFIGLFYGLKGADTTILEQVDNGDETNINHQIHIDGLMSDFLEEKETQRVKETRDAYYRLLFEADKYTVKIKYNSEGEIESAESFRNNGKWIKPAEKVVDESDKLKIKVIQDNEKISNETFLLHNPHMEGTKAIYEDLLAKNQLDYLTLLEIDRGDYSPRFRLEKYVKKIVVKERTKTTAKIELYISKYQEQYNKIHALFLNEIHRIMEEKEYKTDLFDMERLGFVTNGRAWGASPAAVFSYKKLRFDGIKEYDGNYIISFVGTIIKNGENVGEKYKTKELDEKYKNIAPKTSVIDISAAERRNDALKKKSLDKKQ